MGGVTKASNRLHCGTTVNEAEICFEMQKTSFVNNFQLTENLK